MYRKATPEEEQQIRTDLATELGRPLTVDDEKTVFERLNALTKMED